MSNELINSARILRDKTIDEHPELKNEVLDLFSLMLTEISDGESTVNEVSLFENSIQELLDENM